MISGGYFTPLAWRLSRYKYHLYTRIEGAGAQIHTTWRPGRPGQNWLANWENLPFLIWNWLSDEWWFKYKSVNRKISTATIFWAGLGLTLVWCWQVVAGCSSTKLMKLVGQSYYSCSSPQQIKIYSPRWPSCVVWPLRSALTLTLALLANLI